MFTLLPDRASDGRWIPIMIFLRAVVSGFLLGILVNWNEKKGTFVSKGPRRGEMLQGNSTSAITGKMVTGHFWESPRWWEINQTLCARVRAGVSTHYPLIYALGAECWWQAGQSISNTNNRFVEKTGCQQTSISLLKSPLARRCHISLVTSEKKHWNSYRETGKFALFFFSVRFL